MQNTSIYRGGIKTLNNNMAWAIDQSKWRP